MEQELCPACKSAKTELITIEGEQWWQCRHQGCSGRVSGAWFYFKPGEGLSPKAGKPEADEEEETSEDN